MSEMVERVAKALCAQAAEEDGDPTGEGYWQRQARAAFAAMREPTDAMTFEGQEQVLCGVEHGGMADDTAANAWRAMIGAASEDGAPR